ncbi:Uncharacterised protein [Burkholderia pseudomallei]|nr:Uncharacterised protein [Burkholderia pseudomallei]
MLTDYHQLVWVQHPVGDGWTDAPDLVIWAAVDSLDAVWRDTPEYVGRDGHGSDQDGKYEAVGRVSAMHDRNGSNFHSDCFHGRRNGLFHGWPPSVCMVARSRPASVAGRS